MKKILVTTLVACALVSSALAQGQITFSATGTPTPNYIQYSLDGKLASAVRVPATDQVPGYGKVNIALYGAPVGTTLSLIGGIPDLTGQWKVQTSPLLSDIGPAAGGMTGKIVQMDPSSLNAAGELQLTVVAWTGDYSSLLTASQNGALIAFTGDALSGGALTWLSGSGSATTPYVITKGANAFNGLILAPIPEPSTFALAGLGAAALLIFRRRK